MRRGVASAAAAWLAFAAGAGAAEGDSELFTFRQLAFPERTFARHVDDLDGDRLADLFMVFERGGGAGWALRVCRQLAGGLFPPSQCAVFELAGDVRAFDVCSAEEGGAWLVLLTDSGARVRRHAGGTLGDEAPLPGARSLLLGTDPHLPFRLPVCFDLDGDGRDELVLPTRRGPALLRPGGGDAQPRVLRSPSHVAYRSAWRDVEQNLLGSGRRGAPGVQTRTTSPELLVDDFDGDGRKDVVTVLHNVVRAFLQRPDGSFPEEPDRVVSRAELTSGPGDDDAGEMTSVADLDGNGRADLVVLRWGVDERTRRDRSIYYARSDGDYPEVPDQRIRSESIVPGTSMHDLNGDGRRELVVPYFHVAPAQAVRVLTQQSLKLQLRVFRMREDGRYAQAEGNPFARVDQRIVLDYKLDVLGMLLRPEERPEGALAPLIVVEADVNGDGFADILADDGDDALRIFLGNAEARYASDPEHRVPLESAWAFHVLDANGDGRSDVITWYGAGHVRERSSEPLPAGKADRKRARERLREERRGTPEPEPPRTRVKLLLSR